LAPCGAFNQEKKMTGKVKIVVVKKLLGRTDVSVEIVEPFYSSSCGLEGITNGIKWRLINYEDVSEPILSSFEFKISTQRVGEKVSQSFYKRVFAFGVIQTLAQIFREMDVTCETHITEDFGEELKTTEPKPTVKSPEEIAEQELAKYRNTSMIAIVPRDGDRHGVTSVVIGKHIRGTSYHSPSDEESNVYKGVAIALLRGVGVDGPKLQRLLKQLDHAQNNDVPWVFNATMSIYKD
jgi:hypothetical protein